MGKDSVALPVVPPLLEPPPLVVAAGPEPEQATANAKNIGDKRTAPTDQRRRVMFHPRGIGLATEPRAMCLRWQRRCPRLSAGGVVGAGDPGFEVGWRRGRAVVRDVRASSRGVAAAIGS
jgi:hypothetical protein